MAAVIWPCSIDQRAQRGKSDRNKRTTYINEGLDRLTACACVSMRLDMLWATQPNTLVLDSVDTSDTRRSGSSCPIQHVGARTTHARGCCAESPEADTATPTLATRMTPSICVLPHPLVMLAGHITRLGRQTSGPSRSPHGAEEAVEASVVEHREVEAGAAWHRPRRGHQLRPLRHRFEGSMLVVDSNAHALSPSSTPPRRATLHHTHSRRTLSGP